MDTLRGSFGAIGSIIRARSARRLSQSGRPDSLRVRTARPLDPEAVEGLPPSGTPESAQSYGGLRRHQLYDGPMPGSRSALVSAQSQSNTSLATEVTHRRPTITFDRQDVVHSYHLPGMGDNTVTHEHRLPKVSSAGIPPIQPLAAYPPSRSRSHSVPALTSPDSEHGGGRTIIPRRTIPMPGPLSPSSDEDGVDPRGGPTVAKYSRPDARNVFPPSVASTTALSSFPSASDSSSEGQAPWQAVGGEEDYVEVRPGGLTRGKTYPRGVDDRKESVRLWQRGSLDESEESVPGGAGVRLVGPNPPRF
jgi:magnesium transporter